MRILIKQILQDNLKFLTKIQIEDKEDYPTVNIFTAYGKPILDGNSRYGVCNLAEQNQKRLKRKINAIIQSIAYQLSDYRHKRKDLSKRILAEGRTVL